MAVRQMKLAELREYERNPRRITADRLASLKAALEDDPEMASRWNSTPSTAT